MSTSTAKPDKKIKIVIIDDTIGFTGGANIGNDYSKRWHDLMLRLEGPSVASLNHHFLEDWYFATDEFIEPSSPFEKHKRTEGSCVMTVASGPSTEGWIHDAFFSAINRAKERLWLTTPYLIPTDPLRQAIRSAAGRGVDVRIIIPETSDVWIANWAARPYFRPLLRDRVRLYRCPTMVHAKSLIVDDFACVGSANLDNRSMELSCEVCCFLDDDAIVRELSQWQQTLMAKSEEVSEESLEELSKNERLQESIAHLFSPLL